MASKWMGTLCYFFTDKPSSQGYTGAQGSHPYRAKAEMDNAQQKNRNQRKQHCLYCVLGCSLCSPGRRRRDRKQGSYIRKIFYYLSCHISPSPRKNTSQPARSNRKTKASPPCTVQPLPVGYIAVQDAAIYRNRNTCRIQCRNEQHIPQSFQTDCTARTG